MRIHTVGSASLLGGVVGVGESSATILYLNDKNVILRVIYACRPDRYIAKLTVIGYDYPY